MNTVAICITVTDLKELLKRHEALKKQDSAVSDCIVIIPRESTDVLNKSDKLLFVAQSVYQDGDYFLIGQNFKNE